MTVANKYPYHPFMKALNFSQKKSPPLQSDRHIQPAAGLPHLSSAWLSLVVTFTHSLLVFPSRLFLVGQMYGSGERQSGMLVILTWAAASSITVLGLHCSAWQIMLRGAEECNIRQ